MKTNRCSCCGKFKKDDQLVMIEGEADEYWFECSSCCAPVDYDRYFKESLGERTPS